MWEESIHFLGWLFTYTASTRRGRKQSGERRKTSTGERQQQHAQYTHIDTKTIYTHTRRVRESDAHYDADAYVRKNNIS